MRADTTELCSAEPAFLQDRIKGSGTLVRQEILEASCFLHCKRPRWRPQGFKWKNFHWELSVALDPWQALSSGCHCHRDFCLTRLWPHLTSKPPPPLHSPWRACLMDRMWDSAPVGPGLAFRVCLLRAAWTYTCFPISLSPDPCVTKTRMGFPTSGLLWEWNSVKREDFRHSI